MTVVGYNMAVNKYDSLYIFYEIISFSGDSMSTHNNQMFSTKDQKNDNRTDYDCAVTHKGAWWYNRCHTANLNGLYYKGKHNTYADGVNWYTWLNYHYSLEWTEIKTRPKNFRPRRGKTITA